MNEQDQDELDRKLEEETNKKYNPGLKQKIIEGLRNLKKPDWSKEPLEPQSPLAPPKPMRPKGWKPGDQLDDLWKWS
jgi:hypothetical protein